MKTGIRWGIAGLVLLCDIASAAGSFSSLEERMTASQFKAAGLDKLSSEELAALNSWLREQAGTSVAAPAAVVDRQPGAREAASTVPEGYALVKTGPGFDESSREPVSSTIDGQFSGWSGFTRFTLANGQVWQQTDRSVVRISPRSDVAVRIAPRMMGVWRMKADGIGQWVQVKRIQ